MDAPNLANISDKITRIEMGLPFYRCYFMAYKATLDQARDETEQEDEETEVVSYAAMCKKFNTPAWSSLKKKTSDVYRLLQQFRFEGREDLFVYDSLIVLGILYCQSAWKSNAKAIAYFGVLQDGGVDK